MADISFGIFVLVFMAALSVFFVRAAWLHWTGSDRAPRRRTARFSADPSVIRGHERGVVPLAGWLTCLTIGMATAGLAPGSDVGAVGFFFVLGSFPLLALHSTIAWFNRPKFLVPPHLRDETGSVTEWWRHRRDLRAELKKAARRDARGQGPAPD
ncbi:hypothetical protein ACWEO4_31785 [Streptomyces sp. NPDC004393]|uniref:hypothetical protein n=1 Tax=Streptomyces sp. NPDC004533 TaxID=3154278 RepID=UPI0033A115C7